MFMKKNTPVFILLWVLSPFAFSDVLLDVDFRQGDEALSSAGLMPLEGGLPGTGLRDVPHRSGQGAVRAWVRDLREAPLWPDGRLDIARNEVQQGLHRVFSTPRPFNPAEEVLVMRTTTFSDASTGGTNSIAVRLWVQNGLGPNEHRERLELSTHFNLHPRGARQVYPNAYFVRDGWETWAMPEGNNSRRAGVYYRLAAEGRNDEIRGPLAVPLGFYWTWEGLSWAKGWQPPLGGGLYEPPVRSAEIFPGEGLYTVTTVWARTETALPGDPHRFTSRVDVLAPRHEGRVLLEAPLPEQVEEIRLILRSETPSGDRSWVKTSDRSEGDDLFLGVTDAGVSIHPRADVNLNGEVNLEDWDVLLSYAGKEEALHVHGDLMGDGRVGVADAFFLAARLSSPEQDSAAPELWRAWRDADGRLMLRIPPGGRLYAWMLEIPEPLPDPAAIIPVFGKGALTESGGQRLGGANLREPLFDNDGTSRELKLGNISFRDNSQQTLRIQTRLGSEALTLPILVPPASE
jgi:hypothetical protein